MSGTRQLLRELLTACLPPDRWLVRGSRRADGAPAISLTFDDGPHPEFTPQVLDALARWQARGTFFVVGHQAARFPTLVQRIHAEGHEVANHTWTHREPRETSTAEFLDEVVVTGDWLSQHVGPASRWVRPPKGELTWGKFRALWKTGHSIALWNIDPRDYRMTSPDDVTHWCDSYQPRAGDIILLHDRFPWAAEIVDALGHRGLFEQFRTVAIDDWSGNGGDVRTIARAMSSSSTTAVRSVRPCS